jgi:hypothetical protein
MKQAGIYVMIFGLLITVYTGFKYVTKEEIVKIGEFEVTADKTNRLEWSPMLGVAVIVIGGVLYAVGNKR